MASLRIKRLAGGAGMQTIVPQLIGMALFLALSKLLPKETFGLMGWYTAVGYLLMVVGSFGLEQVVLRRVAAGKGQSDWAAKAFWLHNLVVSLLLLVVLGGIAWAFPGAKTSLLPYFFAAQAFLGLAMPFRLLLNARLRYKGYAVATITANLAKLLAVYLVYRAGALTLFTTACIFIGGNALEYLLARLAARQSHTGLPKKRAYRLLLREAAPQYVAVLFDVCLARLDWILLGLLATTASVAEYSFAYRAYEVEKLPTAMISSLLLPLAARWRMADKAAPEEERQKLFAVLLFLIPALMGWAGMAALLLWKPVIGGLLKSEFGQAAYVPIGLLNISLALQFAINLLWVQAFAARKYRLVTRTTALAAVLNLLFNLLFIPALGAVGAAVSVVLSSAFQWGSYARGMRRTGFAVPLRQLLLVFGVNAVFILTLLLQKMPFVGAALLVFIFYPVVLGALGIFTPRHFKALKSFRTAS